MTAPLVTEDELATILGIREDRIPELRRRYNWPHVRLGRTFRFTQAHVEQIIAGHSAEATAEPTTTTAALAGQTSRSASRRRAG